MQCDGPRRVESRDVGAIHPAQDAGDTVRRRVVTAREDWRERAEGAARENAVHTAAENGVSESQVATIRKASDADGLDAELAAEVILPAQQVNHFFADQ